MDIKQARVKEEINVDEELVLFQDTVFEKDIKCKDIICTNKRWNIVAGDINAWDVVVGGIDAWDINAWDVVANNIDAGDIIAEDIVAEDIVARVILCEKRIKKSKKNKTVAGVFVDKVGERKRKEWVT